MSDRLVPVGPELFLAEGPNVDFHGFPYPTRMVVARLEGGLWVWSPITLDDELRRAVDALGEVRHLVEPNKIHHLSLGEWNDAYPDARMWGLPSLVAKRDDLEIEPLSDEPPDAWLGQIDQVVFRGSPVMDEIVFFHRESSTAIFGDLIENFDQAFLREHWAGWKLRVARVWGITAPDGEAPLEWRLSFLRRGPAREALDTVLGWDPEHVVMAHGEWVSENGRELVERSFRWLR